MKRYITSILSVSVLLISLLIPGCYPSKKAVSMEPGSNDTVTSPTKVFMNDASVLLLPDGFEVIDSTLFGRGERHWMDGTYQAKEFIVPLDSIAAMTYYDKKHNIGTVIGSLSVGTWGSIISVFAVICAIDPKSCFGSCPTVYTAGEDEYKLESELFSYSISRFYQEDDLDKLIQGLDPDGSFHLRLTNEAPETHYINQLNLLAVHHPAETEVFPTDDGKIITARNLAPPVKATDYLGKDILPLVREKDNYWFRSDSSRLENMSSNYEKDWIDLSMKVPDGAENLNVILRLRNTLLSTVIFYDLVLASQGVKAIEWTERLNTDQVYAAAFHSLLNNFAGITVKKYSGGEWKEVRRLRDVGPIAWKELAFQVPVESNDSKEISVRLEWFPDNYMIDYIGYETDSGDKEVIQELVQPQSIQDFRRKDVSEAWPKIAEPDSLFMVTYPGESYYFDYQVASPSDLHTTLFVQSKGYYTEWLRRKWITPKSGEYRFELYNVDETVDQLKKSWAEKRSRIEKEFFETRIPLKEEL